MYTATAPKTAGRRNARVLPASRGLTMDEDPIDEVQDDQEGQEGDEKYVPNTPRLTVCA